MIKNKAMTKNHKDFIIFSSFKLQYYNNNSLKRSNFDQIAIIYVHFSYEYFNNQATGQGWEPILRLKLKRDRDQDQAFEQEMTMNGTGTGPGPSPGTGPSPKTFSVFFVFFNLTTIP